MSPTSCSRDRRRGNAKLPFELAVGASRGHLIRQLLVESFMLSLAGAAAGLLIAEGSLQLLNRVRPAFMPDSFVTPIDGTVLAFTGVLTVLTSLAFGLAPAFQSARQDVVTGLKNSRALVRRTSGGDFGSAPSRRPVHSRDCGARPRCAVPAQPSAGPDARNGLRPRKPRRGQPSILACCDTTTPEARRLFARSMNEWPQRQAW